MQPDTGIILLIPSAREFDRGLRRGINKHAQNHGEWMFHEEAPPYLQDLTPRQRLQNMRSWNARGVIAPIGRLPEIQRLRLPGVVYGGIRRPNANYCQVISAHDEIAQLGAKTLLGLGLRHLAYCGLGGLLFSDYRATAFRRMAEEAGQAAIIYSASTAHPGKSWYREQRELARWLKALPKPVGLMACNDDRARMLAEICRMERIRVPDDIAILGVDNDELVCETCNPPLSSIALSTERSGYEAAGMLAAILGGGTPASRVVVVRPTHVVSRRSTDVLATRDWLVADTLRFIRKNSNRDLRVADLAAVTGISSRALQTRFLKELGRTPLEEIHNRRVERIAGLLLETNMTIGEIAAASGFQADAHVARFFSRLAGMSPLAYRKKNRIS